MIDFDAIPTYLDDLMNGLWVTLALTGLTMFFGILIAVPIALARNSDNPILKSVGILWIFFFRGPPALVLLYLLYYGTAEFEWVRQSIFWSLVSEPFTCAVTAMTLNSSGYVAEILRGAFSAVPRGEVEAAVASGFTRRYTFCDIVAPHAARIALRAYGNEIIFVLKGTSIASLVTVIELTGMSRHIYSLTYDPFTPAVAAAIIYVIVILALTWALGHIELWLAPELRIRQASR